MKPNKYILRCAMLAVAIMAAATSAPAQQINGTPGSPDATMTISGKQLPPPDPQFGGVIKDTATDSKPYWPPTVVPPKGAPNVLLDHDRRSRVRRLQHLRRRDSDAGNGSHREGGIALHPISLHRAVLSHTRSHNHPAAITIRWDLV